VFACLIAIFVALLVGLAFNPRVRQCAAGAGDLARYCAGVSAFDTHVRFWGEVVDQDGNSVKGATIKATVTTLRMIKVDDGYRE